MSKKRAFTLVELLAVIAIIALLMSILMPALARAKKQAMAVACAARGHQWGVILSAYSNNNDGYFHSRRIGDPEAYFKIWPYPYKPYYNDKIMRYCPTAQNDNRIGGVFGVWNLDYGEYNPRDPEYWVEGEEGPCLGSIGFNRYLMNVTGGGYDNNPSFWRRSDVKGADEAAVIVDCQYVCIWPGSKADPPTYHGDWTVGDTQAAACLDRHLGGVNVVFLDYSVRKVGLKELWALKWTRTYDTCDQYTKCGNEGEPSEDWPKWMKDYKDY